MKKLSEKRKKEYFKMLLYLHEHQCCEVCGGKVIDSPHHIIYRSQGGDSNDENLITLCRLHHDQAHFKVKPYLYKRDLWSVKGLDVSKMEEKLRTTVTV